MSSYRLGDIIVQGFDDASLNSEILNKNPNTIGSDYILSNSLKVDRIGLAIQIIFNHCQKYNHLFPQNFRDSTVVHLRLGDSLGNHFHEKRLRPIDVSYYKLVIPDGKVYVIGKCHFGKGSSTNYEECTELSNKYMREVLNILGATYFNGGHPDIDLCFAIQSKLFIQGRGFFSQLIVDVRKRLGLKSIETQSHIFN
jgi:hypothetical protein